MTEATAGTWFVENGTVMCRKKDGTIVSIAHMDRDEPGTSPVERDENAIYIVMLQNLNTQFVWELVPSDSDD